MDKYVKQVVVKSGVKKENGKLYYIAKGCVDASMKKQTYTSYVHLEQLNTGEVAYAHCMCPAGKEGCCSQDVALFFQIIECIQLDVRAIPDVFTCTQLLQQWHVPRNDELDEPILCEDVVFEQASYEKDQSRKSERN